MDEIKLMRARAREMMSNPDEIIRASQLLKNIESIEHHRAQKQKLSTDLPDSRMLQYLNLLAPVVTVLILVVTLFVQERDRVGDQKQAQQDKTENRDNEGWDRAVRAAADRQAENRTAAIILLRGIEQSQSRYVDQASKLVISILRGTKTFDEFQSLFSAEFTPPAQEDLDRILNLDRSLHQEWVNKKKTNPNYHDSADKHLVIQELSFICTQIHPLLQKRPTNRFFNLRFVAFFDCDLPDIDLTGANLEGFTTARVTMLRSKLDEVTNFKDGYWKDTAWWEAGSMSPSLLQYLEAEAPFKAEPEGHYGRTTMIDEGRYKDSLIRLGSTGPLRK